MKSFSLIILCLALIITSSCKTQEDIDTLPLHNKKVLILGNSITQNGRYVDFLEYYLRKQYPNETLDIISIGLSSETVSGDSEADHPFPRPCVHSRLDDALKHIKPDLVLACYGMNDGIFSEKDDTRFSNYKNGITTLIKKVENTGAKIILLTPTPFDPDPIKNRLANPGEPQSYQHPYHNYGDVLTDYANWLTQIEGAKVINLNSYLNKALVDLKQQNPDSTFIPDGVHPNDIGHFYMAKKILSDLYPEIVVGEATSEVEPTKVEPLFVVSSSRRKLRSDGWLDYVGYTRGETVKSEDINTIIEKVKKMDVTIKQTQNYTRE